MGNPQVDGPAKDYGTPEVPSCPSEPSEPGNTGGVKMEKYFWKVQINSSNPMFETSHKIELNDEAEFLYYSNIATDGVALLLAKIGQEFSKYQIDKDKERLSAAVTAMLSPLNTHVLSGDGC